MSTSNNISSINPQPNLRSQARDWVIRFNRDTAPSKADIAELRAWATQSADHRQALHEAQQVWADADQLAELAVPIAHRGRRALRAWLHRVVQQLTPQTPAGTASTAACALLSVVALGWYLSIAGIAGNGEYRTSIGQQRLLVLEDNSSIQLDTNSQLRIAYSEGSRQIILQQGKAYFDVAKNPDRPFQVYAAGGMVQAVGTAFTVAVDNQDIEVTVDEGRVNLARVESAQPTAVFLSVDSSQSAVFNSSQQTLIQLADNELSQELAWRRGLLIFAGEPLSTVVQEVSRYTPTTIEISDPELRQLLIGGRFRTGELEALFDVLETGFGVRISYRDNNHIELHAAPKQ